MMFNNNKLPLIEAQQLQQKVARKVEPIERNDELDQKLALEYQQGNVQSGLQLFNNYLDIISFIYRKPNKAKNRGSNKVDIRSKTTKEDKEDLFQEICTHFFGLLLEFDSKVSNLQSLIKGKLHLRVYKYYFEDLLDVKVNEKELQEDFDLAELIKEIFIEDDTNEISPQKAKLFEAFGELSEKQRKVLELTVVRGWDSSVVSKEIKTTPAHIRVTKQRSLERLKKLMEVDLSA